MFPTRQGCLAAIAAVALIPPSFTLADEPDFRLLRIAEELAEQVEVRPVQFEEDLFGSSGEEVGQQGTQPVDIQSPGGLESFDPGELTERLGFGSFDRLGQSSLNMDTSALVDSDAFISDLEQVQGTSDIALSDAPAVDIVGANTFNLAGSTDVGDTLSTSAGTQTVRARRRSPLGVDPRIRGFYVGQIYTSQDGSYQFPVRSDLDGMLSKIDPSLIGNVQLFSGPYTVRYGSGFAFLNVDTIPAPRYECGWENHIRLGTHLRTNGGQTYNTMTLFGGGESLGYFANVGYRKGSDYAAGDGLLIPSSYEAFNLFSGVGFDHSDYTRSEVRYNHIDQGPTEYAGQFYDVNDLKSDGLVYSLIHRDERQGFAYRVDTWGNYTDFNGDTFNASKRRPDFPVLQRVDQSIRASLDPRNTNNGMLTQPELDVEANNNMNEFRSTVDGSLTSAGFRAGMTQDLDRDSTYGMGLDFRYLRQNISENILLSDFQRFVPGTGIQTLQDTETGIPDAEVFEPGMYVEYSFSPKQYIDTAVGARIGFATTQADENELRPLSNLQGEDLDVSDVLTSFFITNNLDLAPNWSARLGFGYAERVPNLDQRYSDGLFLAIIQSGFSRVIGDPTLSKERNWQIDAQINFDSQYVRSRLSGFNSWIVDYITYQANIVEPPTGARLLRAINTEYATLTGFEYYCEADLTDGWQVFGSLAYLDGRDREINAPLAGISPLEGRAGLRWMDFSPQNRWGVEWGLRMVDNQDRLGTYRAVAPVNGLVELETPTPGFTTSYLRAFFQPTRNVNITMGAENLFDNNYFDALSLRLPPETVNGASYGQTAVLSPGLTPYVGVEIDY